MFTVLRQQERVSESLVGSLSTDARLVFQNVATDLLSGFVALCVNGSRSCDGCSSFHSSVGARYEHKVKRGGSPCARPCLFPAKGVAAFRRYVVCCCMVVTRLTHGLCAVTNESTVPLDCVQQCFMVNVMFFQLSPLFHLSREPIRLSSVVEQLCQRVSNLQYIVTIVTQVRVTLVCGKIFSIAHLRRPFFEGHQNSQMAFCERISTRSVKTCSRCNAAWT